LVWEQILVILGGASLPVLPAVVVDGAFRARGEGESIMSNRIQSLALVILAAPVMALALAAATVSADTIYVCWDGSGDYLTIQEGIDAAVDGDEVVVCDGTYTSDGNQDLDFGGKSITVRSESSDPNACIIDCERSGRGFYFHSGETAVVDGFTITNGYARHDGAGVHCEGAEATITNCTISSNEAEFDGGGVCCWDGSLTITDLSLIHISEPTRPY